MKISVITPTYNRKDTLGKLYNSILNNLQCDIEIEWLIMDDGSTDGTEECIQKFKEEKKNLHKILQTGKPRKNESN